MILRYSSSIMDFRRLLRLIFLTITLLLFTGCAVNGVHDQQASDGHSSGDDDGSGLMSGEGSGSGQVYIDDKSQTNQPKCSVDMSDVPFTPIGQEDVVLQAKCRSVCLEKVLANETLPHHLISTDEFYQTVSTKSLRNDCSVYQKVYECAVGCEMGNDQSCSSNCYDMCSDNSLSYLPNSSCPFSCSKAVCAIGCGLYEELNTIASEGSVPEHPSSYNYSFNNYSSPYFHAPAAYKITFETNDTINSTTITGFVIKLTTDEHTTHYYLPSLDTPLVIDGSLVCQTVIVQILPVNKFGPAQNYMYSSNLTIVTDGGMWPQWPDHPQLYSLDYSITEDDRDGYWQHAIVNITWNTPHNREFLTGYTIQLLSDDQFNCGPTLEITDIQQTYFVWQASIPADSPISGCNYDIKVFSNPHNSTYPGTPGVLNVPIDNLNNTVPMGLIAPVDIKCALQDIEGNILYLKPRMEWMLLSNPLLLQGIKEFQLTLIGRTDGNDQSIKTDIIQFMTFRNVRSQKIHFTTTYNTLLQELTIIYKPGYTQYFNTSYSCSHHLIQPPPIVEVIPNDIYIDHTTGDLHIDVMWEETMFSDGDISDYLVYVGKTIQPSDTILIDNTTHFLVSTTSVHRYIKEVLQSPNDINSEWYIQVQSISSIGLRSIWSSPYVFDPFTTEFHVNVELSCKHLFQESQIQASFQTHQLYIHWTVSSTKLEGLEGFDIIATYTGNSKTKNDEHIMGYKNTQDEYSYIFNETVFFNDHFNYYELEVVLLFKEGYPNRGPATRPYCILDGSLLPPSTIEYNLVKLDALQIDKFGRLNISMDWTQPNLSHGGIREYWVYIGPTSLSGAEEPHDYVLFTKDLLYSHYHQSNIDIYKQLQSQFGNGSSWKLYIQVLSINNVQVMSNWTTAHVILMDAFELVEYPKTSSTTVLPSPTITKKPATTPTTDAYQKLVPVLSVIIPIIFVLTLAIILVIVLITIACCQRKKIGNKKQKHLMVDVNQRMDTGYLWERFPSDVEKMLLIGEGTFGDVYSGVLHQTIGRKQFDDDSVNVFIATLKVSSSEDERFEFVNVLEKHKALSSVDHPFFLFFQGCVTSSQPYYLMTDFAENGDLLTFLQNHKRRLLSETASIRDHTITQDKVSSYLHYQHPSYENLCPGDLLNYSRQIASAMDCLTGLGIVHGDLACRNIYIDQNFNLKVADFGIVNNGHRGVIYVKGVPIRWVSPKVLIDHTYSTTSDIWAFGVTVWEIVTLGDFPYQDIRNEDLLKSLTEGNRLPQPNNCSPLFFSTLLSCWDINPKRRPAFEKLHETFLTQLSKNEASILLTIPLSTQEPHPLYGGEPSTDIGTKSPTSDHSSDSAISDVGITKHDELISATNRGFTQHSITDVPIPIHKGFANPGFRRSSTKSVNLDSPSFQIFQSNPATEQATITLGEISEKDVTIDTTNTTTEV